jgi:hypothetical protein
VLTKERIVEPFLVLDWRTIAFVAASIIVVVLTASSFSSGGSKSSDNTAQAAPARQTAAQQGKGQSPAQADHPTVRPHDGSEAVTWSETEIAAALQECARLLAAVDAKIEFSKPIRNGQCGTPAPVILKRVAGVEISPPAVVNCRLAAKLHQWVKETLQPTAQEVLGTHVKAIANASAYTCRQRIGNPNERLSEHSFANALDISAFVTADGRSIALLTHWGQTERDRQAQAKSGALAGGDARSLTDAAPANTSREGQFLRRMHASACGMFGTVLGPEANEAHRDHLHLDLAARRLSSFCQ